VVTASDLRLPESEIHALCNSVLRRESGEDLLEFFAAITWSVICEPGDAFAGQLISTFGAASALALELSRTSAKEYVALFSEAGSDWLEMQKFGRFERTLADARERWHPRLSPSRVRQAVEAISALDGWFMTRDSEHWPVRLNDLGNHAPRGLWGLGKGQSNPERSLSVVGSRIATSYGENSTGELVGPMVSRGYTVISGGAYGIDAHAHRSTLALEGSTVAVMAGGLDRLYPSGNRELFKDIAARGLLLSELPPGAEPTKWRFLQRNRLIAALGDATLLVEAHARSGAVSTANRAVDLGRPVGAVPGAINSPGSDGCHQLIRDFKAQLVTCSADILELIGEGEGALTNTVEGLGALETRVLDVIGARIADISRICGEGGLTRSEAEVGIASLSLLGLIDRDSSGWRRKL
jgi:DNA processing protein